MLRPCTECSATSCENWKMGSSSLALSRALQVIMSCVVWPASGCVARATVVRLDLCIVQATKHERTIGQPRSGQPTSEAPARGPVQRQRHLSMGAGTSFEIPQQTCLPELEHKPRPRGGASKPGRFRAARCCRLRDLCSGERPGPWSGKALRCLPIRALDK